MDLNPDFEMCLSEAMQLHISACWRKDHIVIRLGKAQGSSSFGPFWTVVSLWVGSLHWFMRASEILKILVWQGG